MARLPRELQGVYLGMSEPDLLAARPRAGRHPPADSAEHYVFHETLQSSQQAVFLFDRRSGRLTRVQIAGQLRDLQAIGPRLEELQEEHGTPSGVWDCPISEGNPLPTRRLTWTRGLVGVMDVVLLLGERSLATLYVASVQDIEDSVRHARCIPTPPDRFHRFPAVPTPPSAAP